MLIDNDDLRQLHTAILSIFGLAKDRRLQCVHVHSSPAPGGVLKHSLSRYRGGCDDRQRFTLKVSVSFLYNFYPSKMAKWWEVAKDISFNNESNDAILSAKLPDQHGKYWDSSVSLNKYIGVEYGASI